MTRTRLYGTVYNSKALWIKESIKSVWRPDAKVVIVDFYSTDRTWGNYLSYKKQPEVLSVYMYTALYCPGNSTTTYFNLNTAYNQAFHRSVECGTSTGLAVHLSNAPGVPSTSVVRRKALPPKGGWRDLDFAGGWNATSWMDFDVAVPVITDRNASQLLRCKRRHRGEATSLERLLVLRAKRFTLTYVYVRIMGLCRNGKPNNVAWIELASLTRLVSLREIWMLYKYFSYTAMLLRKVKDGEKTIDSHVSTIISKHVFKVWWKAYWIRIMYFNDHEWLDESYVPLVERIGVLK